MDLIQFMQLQTAVMTQSVLLAKRFLREERGRDVTDEEALIYVNTLYRFVASRVDLVE